MKKTVPDTFLGTLDSGLRLAKQPFIADRDILRGEVCPNEGYVRNTIKNIPVLLMVVAFALLLASCAKQNPVSATNSAPSIRSLTWTPQDVRPKTNVTFTLTATDADGDTLDYQWEADSGTFIGQTTQKTAIWTAPSNVGLYDVIVAVSDGHATIVDTAAVLVAIELTASITAPVDSVFVVPGTSITFTGTVAGYSSITDAAPSIQWESDVDSLLSTAAVSSQGVTTFSTISLSDTIHHISLTATVNDTIVASDTIVVNNHKPSAPTIYAVERRYTKNRISWSTSYRADRFDGFSLLRRETFTGTETEIASIDSIDTTYYVDDEVKIGQRYIYRVKLKTKLGASAYSDTTSITTGVFKTVKNGTVGSLAFGSGITKDYVYATLPSKDSLYVIDVTGNNIDYRFKVGDQPWGICTNTSSNKVYIANSNDTTVSVIDMTSPGNASTRYSIHMSVEPKYLDYFERDSVLYVTAAENHYPLIIREYTDGSDSVTTLDNPSLRLIMGGSIVKVDDINERLYISEIGDYSAGLWKFNLAADGTSPALQDSISQGALGYGLQDFALVPPAFDNILVASTSPYLITVVNATDFSLSDPLETGPYPNAIAISQNGYAYVGLSNANSDDYIVQKWDIDNRSAEGLSTYSFAEPIIRGGIALSPDDNFLVVATYNSTTHNSRLSIIYLLPEE